MRDALLGVVAERLDERQHEERQPAGGERAHYDAKRSCGFALFDRQRRTAPKFALTSAP